MTRFIRRSWVRRGGWRPRCSGTTAPTLAELAAAWPARAGAAGFGHVALRCRIEADGRLTKCLKLSEEPRGRGFYDAARTLLPRFRMRTDGLDPGMIGQIDVNLPIHFTDPKADAPVRVLAKPEWTKRIADNHAAGTFPAKAAAAGLETGRAVVDCRVGLAGQLEGCRPLVEQPGDMGFGEAGVALATPLAVNPWTADGLPAEGARVRFAVRIDNTQANPGTK